jgi:hypothetical protein
MSFNIINIINIEHCIISLHSGMVNYVAACASFVRETRLLRGLPCAGLYMPGRHEMRCKLIRQG